MEYLMTYGWAILIIAVVLGVLFQLGVFSGSALTPKAQPGACQVQRLLGQTSLEGQCTGLQPQYVAQFGGWNSYIETSSNMPIYGNPSFTITGWFYLTPAVRLAGDCSTTPCYDVLGWGAPGTSDAVAGLVFNLEGTKIISAEFDAAPAYVNSQVPTNQWIFIAFTKSPGTISSTSTFYVNGTNQGAITGSSSTPAIVSAPLYIGQWSNFVNILTFNGLMANVQVYNTTLSANEVKALYLEGIGGAPVKIQSLVGWWPLNGNANDYSGNNNNGQITGQVSFNGTWSSAYTPP